MTAIKIITSVVLITVGAHLLLYGFLRRKIAEAKRQQERQQQEP